MPNVSIEHLDGAHPTIIAELRVRSSFSGPFFTLLGIVLLIVALMVAVLAGVRIGTTGDYRDTVISFATWLGHDDASPPAPFKFLLALDARQDAGPLSRHGTARVIANLKATCEQRLDDILVRQTDAHTSLRAQVANLTDRMGAAIGAELQQQRAKLKETNELADVSLRSCVVSFFTLQRLVDALPSNASSASKGVP